MDSTKNQRAQSNTKTQKGKTLGFSITEVLTATAITGVLSAVALPNYMEHMHGSRTKDAITTIGSLQATLGAFMDATGERPTTWDDLTSIAAIMTDDGQATGDLNQEIILPGSIYKLKVETINENTYTFNATRVDNVPNHDVRACFNISNGASDINSGNGEVNAMNPNCS